MPLNPRLVVAPSLEMYFVDKDTGLPLTGGKVTFYKDNSRTVKKDVYQISGSPPNYTYVALPNPVTLSAVGTIQNDSGDNVLPYYYPYEGLPTDETPSDITELYYITVESSGGVAQFTREGWPNISSATSSAQELINLVANPQFALNNNFPVDETSGFVNIDAEETAIAPGGWWFLRPTGSSATDSYKFVPFDSVVSLPTGNPRYALNVKNTGGADAYKYLAIRWNNVNMFASDDQSYTFNFYGKSDSGNVTLDVKLIKFFGTGSTTPTSTRSIGTINLTNSFNWAGKVTFQFGDNATDQVGDLNDDYVEIVVSLPTDQSFNYSFTDFILTPGNVDIEIFPYKPYEIAIPESTVGYPEELVNDGSDLYLPIVKTKSGTTVDKSMIGAVFALSYALTDYDSDGLAPDTNNISCIGNHAFRYAGYAPLGIPFKRLGDKYWNETYKVYQWGTGVGYVSALVSLGLSNDIILANNELGNVAIPADGAGGSATGFTFTQIASGSATDYGVTAHVSGINTLWVKGLRAGHITSPTNLPINGLSSPGFIFKVFKNPANVTAYFEFEMENTAPPSIAGGDYIVYFAEGGSGNVEYVPWFKVNGVGSAPVTGATKIEIDLVSSYTADDVANILAFALSACRVTSIVTQAASTLSGGEYWTFVSTDYGTFVVWYTVDGAGTKPVVSGVPTDNYIKVELAGTDTAAQVSDKTRTQINKTYFAVPNFAGAFLRGYDPNGQWDIVNTTGADFNTRFGYGPGIWGNQIGTFELDYYTSHYHQVEPIVLNTPGSTQGLLEEPSLTNTNASLTTESGGTETRPINASINWIVKY